MIVYNGRLLGFAYDSVIDPLELICDEEKYFYLIVSKVVDKHKTLE